MTNHLCRAAAVAFLAFIFVSADAQTNWIIQWNANVPPGKYSIDQGLNKITILEGYSGLFKFEAIDLSTPYPHEPGVIDRIESASVGEVRIMIHGSPSYGRTYGATHVKSIDLSNCHPGKLDLTTI